MVAYHEWLSLTRMTGLAAYTASLLACGWRWAKCREIEASRRLYAMLALVQFCLLLDMAFNWRWKLHDLGVQVAAKLGVYDLRRTPQLLVLLALALALALLSALIFYRLRRRIGVALALTGTLQSTGLWCLECVSLHAVDRVLYRLIGGVMTVSLAWIFLALVTCLGVWLDFSRHPAASLTR
jgi:hypothetical protein